MTLLKMRTAPGGGPNAEGFKSRLEEVEHTQPETLSQYDEWIETAEDYERVLAIKMARLRRLILNIKCKRDWLGDLGSALSGWRA